MLKGPPRWAIVAIAITSMIRMKIFMTVLLSLFSWFHLVGPYKENAQLDLKFRAHGLVSQVGWCFPGAKQREPAGNRLTADGLR